jgi:hypothetical protein
VTVAVCNLADVLLLYVNQLLCSGNAIVYLALRVLTPQKSTSSEARSRSAGQETPAFYAAWVANNIPQLGCTARHVRSAHTLTFWFFKVHFITDLASMRRSRKRPFRVKSATYFGSYIINTLFSSTFYLNINLRFFFPFGEITNFTPHIKQPSIRKEVNKSVGHVHLPALKTKTSNSQLYGTSYVHQQWICHVTAPAQSTSRRLTPPTNWCGIRYCSQKFKHTRSFRRCRSASHLVEMTGDFKREFRSLQF